MLRWMSHKTCVVWNDFTFFMPWVTILPIVCIIVEFWIVDSVVH
jgi:hypothetical protein